MEKYIETLRQHGASFNLAGVKKNMSTGWVAEEKGWTPLVIVNGHTNMVKLLLDPGAANIGRADRIDWTLPFWAVEAKKLVVLKLLLEKGVQVGSQDQIDYRDGAVLCLCPRGVGARSTECTACTLLRRSVNRPHFLPFP